MGNGGLLFKDGGRNGPVGQAIVRGGTKELGALRFETLGDPTDPASLSTIFMHEPGQLVSASLTVQHLAHGIKHLDGTISATGEDGRVDQPHRYA